MQASFHCKIIVSIYIMNGSLMMHIMCNQGKHIIVLSNKQNCEIITDQLSLLYRSKNTDSRCTFKDQSSYEMSAFA